MACGVDLNAERATSVHVSVRITTLGALVDVGARTSNTLRLLRSSQPQARLRHAPLCEPLLLLKDCSQNDVQYRDPPPPRLSDRGML